MQASAQGESWATKKVPQSVGREFAEADETKAKQKNSKDYEKLYRKD